MALFCWPTAVAFSLTIKTWGFVLIDGLEFVEQSEDAWDQLVLPVKTKEVLLAMAASTQRDSTADPQRYRFRDVVDEKGGGVLFLLYGPPGTGKTLSVEALAASFGRPLYSISFAELGSTVAELEERLTDVLALAAHWGALVLLDEGDALVERRTKGQLLLNSMTGVLLRLLESFNGALFITSNRAASFDPAALSRVTLAVRYLPLDAGAKRAVWRNALARVLMYEHGAPRTRAEALEAVDASFDLDALAAFTGSGRAVGAVIRLAAGLCQQRDRGTLSQAALDDAMSIWQEFHSDLRDEGAVDTFETVKPVTTTRVSSRI
jgi:SpoVK/Ycf46/Vps4 family AAA+-type ATPase